MNKKGTSRKVEGLWSMTVGEREASLKAIEEAIVKGGGEPRQIFDRFRSQEKPDKEFMGRVVQFMLSGGIEGSVSQKVARAIMAKNFFGPEEWITFYGTKFTKKQLREINDFPWSEDVLSNPCPFVKGKTIKETHFAFLGLDKIKGKPLTIMQWQKLHPNSGQPKFYSYGNDAWYRENKFATEKTCQFRWYLMPLEILPNSTNKNYEEQVAILPAEDYEAPLVIEEVTKAMLYFKKNGTYLNPAKYARCQDTSSDGGHVDVGAFDADGLNVDCYWGDLRYGLIGVAASRKFLKIGA